MEDRVLQQGTSSPVNVFEAGQNAHDCIVAKTYRYNVIHDKISEGEGNQSYQAHRIQNDKLCFIKVYKKVIDSISQRRMIANEASALLLLRDKPNIIQVVEVIEDPNHVAIVLEWCGGGDLFDWVLYHQIQKTLTEDVIRPKFAQMVSAVAACHAGGLVHRDLKLDNFVLSQDWTTVKLTDFQHCGRIAPGKLFVEKRGSLPYSSPEVIRSLPYSGEALDVWALGVCLYSMVTYHFPFYDAESEEKTRELILSGQLKLPTSLSPPLCNLLVICLRRDRKRRATIQEIQSHPWLQQTPT